MERQGIGRVGHPLQELDIEHVDRDAAGPIDGRTIGPTASEDFIPQRVEVAVFDHLQPSVDRDHVAHFVAEAAFGDDLG